MADFSGFKHFINVNVTFIYIALLKQHMLTNVLYIIKLNLERSMLKNRRKLFKKKFFLICRKF